MSWMSQDSAPSSVRSAGRQETKDDYDPEAEVTERRKVTLSVI